MNSNDLLPPASRAEKSKLLNIIAVVAILDFVLLIPLVLGIAGVVSHDTRESIVPILGPVHGFGFLALIGLTAYGAGKRYWGWWFPAITVITGGPIGSLIGDLAIRKQMKDA